MKTLISTLVLGVVVLLASCRSFKDVREPQYVDIQNVRLEKVGLLQTTAGVDLVYYNPNDFSIQLSDARGDVYVDNEYLGRFNLGNSIQVGKRKEFVLPVTFKLSNIGTVKNARDIFKKKEALVRIEGMARVTKSGFSKDLPIRFERMQNIDKLRSIVSR